MNNFLPRDAMRKRCLCCRPVSVHPSICLSVCPSVTLVHCIQTAEDIVKLLSQLDSPIILVFGPPTPVYPIPRGTPYSGGGQYTGWENFQYTHNIRGGVEQFFD